MGYKLDYILDGRVISTDLETKSSLIAKKMAIRVYIEKDCRFSVYVYPAGRMVSGDEFVIRRKECYINY